MPVLKSLWCSSSIACIHTVTWQQHTDKQYIKWSETPFVSAHVAWNGWMVMYQHSMTLKVNCKLIQSSMRYAAVAPSPAQAQPHCETQPEVTLSNTAAKPTLLAVDAWSCIMLCTCQLQAHSKFKSLCCSSSIACTTANPKQRNSDILRHGLSDVNGSPNWQVPYGPWRVTWRAMCHEGCHALYCDFVPPRCRVCQPAS